MKAPIFALLGGLVTGHVGAASAPPEVAGQVIELQGKRATVVDAKGQRHTVSLAGGTKVRVGEHVTLSVQLVGDTMLGRTAPARPR